MKIWVFWKIWDNVKKIKIKIKIKKIKKIKRSWQKGNIIEFLLSNLGKFFLFVCLFQ